MSGGPLVSKDDCQLLYVLDCCFSDREDGIFQPIHTDRIKSLIEESLAELFGKYWELLDNT